METNGRATVGRLRAGIAAFLLLAAAGTAAAQERPGGTLVVVNKGAASASVIDVAGGRTVAVLPTGDGPHELVISSDGRRAVVTNYGGQGGGGSTLTVLDVPGASVLSTVALGQYRRPHGVGFLPGDSLLAVTSETSEAVVIVRVADGTVVRALRTGQRGSHMLAVTADGRRIYTGNIGDDTVTELDPVLGQLRLFQVPDQPEAITVSADGAEVWVGSNTQGGVSVVRTRDGVVETPFSGFGWPYRILLVPRRDLVVIPDMRTNTVRFFAHGSRSEVGKLDFPGGGPQGITATPDGRWLFLALSEESRVAVIDLEGMRVVSYLQSGAGPDGVGWSPLAAASGQAQEREAVLAVIRRMFDGMREADSTKVRSVFAEGARFAVIAEREGRRTVEYPAVDGWIGAIARSERRWDERLFDVVVQVDANMASAWTPYSFYLDGRLRHCGVDSIELLRVGEEWKVTQLSDTQRTEGCRELPAGGGGA